MGTAIFGLYAAKLPRYCVASDLRRFKKRCNFLYRTNIHSLGEEQMQRLLKPKL